MRSPGVSARLSVASLRPSTVSRRRYGAAGSIARDVAQHRAIAAARADQEAIGAVGADRRPFARSAAARRRCPPPACAARADRRRPRSPGAPERPKHRPASHAPAADAVLGAAPRAAAEIAASPTGSQTSPRPACWSTKANSVRPRPRPFALSGTRMPSHPSSAACRSRAGAKLGSCWRNPRATFGPAAAANLAALSRSKVCSDVRCNSMSPRAVCQFGRFSTRRDSTLR